MKLSCRNYLGSKIEMWTSCACLANPNLWVSYPALHKLYMVVHTSLKGGATAQGQPWLYETCPERGGEGEDGEEGDRGWREGRKRG